jgi:hypothetical protein
MQFTAEQKSQLAKLMATENLTVEHQKIRTARFDPQNRILYLPIWQFMTGVTYDHLVGHEVGHALYTPAVGWHDAVVDKSKGKNFKSFLNVVEDARIEKKVKRKYPGLNRSFRESFADLMKRDFFGLNGREYSDLCFIDRLNLYTKSQYSLPIEFSTDEQKMVDKVMACETWEDVVAVTGDIYDFSKDEQYEMMMEDFQSFSYSDEYSDEYSDDYDMGDSDSDDEPNKNESVKSKSNSQSEDSDEKSEDDNDGDGNGEETGKQTKSNSSKSDEKGDAEDDMSDVDGGEYNRYKDSTPATRDMFDPRCETDDSFRANEVTLLDEKCKEYVYLTFPKPILKNIVTPAKRVQEQLTKFYFENNYSIYADNARKWVTEFKNKNDRYIGLLAKEFEMRKAAKAFSKSKLSDTGDIDINKLASYKFDDNIFRKVMMTPKGKNHGLVLLLDKSGSMSNNMAGSIEQILVLSMFCRKVNIPFVVYGFGDSIEANMEDLGCGMDSSIEKRQQYHGTKRPCFEKTIKSMALDTVFLREYINNKMSNAEFSNALRNMIMLKKSFEGGRWNRECYRPDSEHLSNTPLTQAIIATAEIMKTFKTTNNLDMTSLIIVHDGDADYTRHYNHEYESIEDKRKYIASKGIDVRNTNVIIRDNVHKFEKKVTESYHSEEMLTLALEWFKKVTGSKVFGFFLIPDNRPSWVRGTISNRYVLEDGSTYAQKLQESQKGIDRWNEQQRIEAKVKEVAKTFKQEKFLISKTPGFTSFFLVSGGDDLKTENEEIEVDGKITANKLKTAFMKLNKKKQINRVLVSKFIQGIAA